MFKKHLISALSLICIVFCILTGCTDEYSQYGSLTLYADEEISRTIGPSPEVLDISYYKVVANHQDSDATINKNFNGNVLVLDKLKLGVWDIYLEGYSSSDLLIAKSDTKRITVDIASDNVMHFKLSYYDNPLTTGSYEIAVSWGVTNTDIDSVELEILKADASQSKVVKQASDAVLVNGRNELKWTGTLPPGTYNANIILKNTLTEQIGQVRKEVLNIHTGCAARGTVSIADINQVEAPVIAPDTGWITSETEISITCPTPGARIFYTLDGSVPTKESTEYHVPLTLNGDKTLKAAAFRDGMFESMVSTAVYRYKEEGGVIVDKPVNPIGNKLTITHSYSTNSEGVVVVPELWANFGFKITDKDGFNVGYTDSDVKCRWFKDGVEQTEATTNKEAFLIHNYMNQELTLIVDVAGVTLSDTIKVISSLQGVPGAIVVYDIDHDNLSGNNDSLVSSTEGWRYLEIAPMPVVYVNSYYAFPDEVPSASVNRYTLVCMYYKECYRDGSYKGISSDDTSYFIGKGLSNTNSITARAARPSDYGFSYVNSTRSEYNLGQIASNIKAGGKSDWFVPSADELSETMKIVGKFECFAGKKFGSSSESDTDKERNYVVCDSDGKQYSHNRCEKFPFIIMRRF